MVRGPFGEPGSRESLAGDDRQLAVQRHEGFLDLDALAAGAAKPHHVPVFDDLEVALGNEIRAIIRKRRTSADVPPSRIQST